MRRLILCSICVMLLGVPAHADEQKVIKLEFSSLLPGHDTLGLLLEQWCGEVERRTGGKVKINYYPGGILTPASQTFDSVITGIADIGFGPAGVTPGRFPLTEVMEQPLGLKSAYMMTLLGNDFFRAFKPKEFEPVKVLFFLSASPGLLHTRRPVSRLEDLNGMKVRCLGGTAARILKTLGATPVVISTGDTYDALRKGIVEGVVAAWDSLETMKWGEILQYTTVSYAAAISTPGFVVMNRTKWNSLSPEYRLIIDGMSDDWAEKLSKLWDQKDRNTVKKWEAKGHKSIFLSQEEEQRWEKAVQPLYEAYIEEKSARGLPAVEALKFCRAWVQKSVAREAAIGD
jgi:TRAP-type C4-dicarboxylate transport system substrate-binding protein